MGPAFLYKNMVRYKSGVYRSLRNLIACLLVLKYIHSARKTENNLVFHIYCNTAPLTGLILLESTNLLLNYETQLTW